MVQPRIKICIDCNQEFSTTRHYYNRCQTCQKKMSESMMKPCILCKKNYIPSNKSRKCSSCIDKIELTCVSCNVKYMSSRSSVWDSPETLCRSCEEVKRDLHDNRVPAKLVIPGFKVVVTYDVHSEEHDGYCSGVEELEVTDVEEVYTYPLLNLFKNEHLDNEGNIVDGPVALYKKDNDNNDNNGCHTVCGAITSYRIKDIKVVRTLFFLTK